MGAGNETARAAPTGTFFAVPSPLATVKTIVRIDAAPGFEDGVEAALRDMDAIFNVVSEKEKNFDLVAGVEAEDANAIRDVENAIRHESGVQGIERVDAPEDALLKRLRPE